MKAYIYKDLISDFTHGTFKSKKYIYKVITENGDIIRAMDFRSDHLAMQLLPIWLEKEGYHVEILDNYKIDPRYKRAKEKYEIRNPGLTLEGEAY